MSRGAGAQVRVSRGAGEPWRGCARCARPVAVGVDESARAECAEPSCTISMFQLLASSGTAVLPCSQRTFEPLANGNGFGERLTADVAVDGRQQACEYGLVGL